MPVESRREEKRAFRLFDKNNDGVINKDELGHALRQVSRLDSDSKRGRVTRLSPCVQLGQNPSDEELKDMIQEIDKENKGCIDLNDFLNLISQKAHNTQSQTPPPGLSLSETLQNATEDDMKEAFRVFDRDGDGFINDQEMLLTLLGLGETSVSEERVKEIIASADEDHDGKLSYPEFVKYLGVNPRPAAIGE